MSRTSLGALALAALLAACSEVTPPTAAPIAALPAAPPLLAAGGQAEGPTPLDLVEDDYAKGNLDRDNANRYRQYAVSALDKLPAKYRVAGRGKDATQSMLALAREWKDLSPAARNDIDAVRRDGFGHLRDSVVTAHYVLHYTTTGRDAVPAIDANADGRPDFIEAAARSWEYVWNRQVVELGYPAPRGTPATKFHVWYQEMPYYGYCMPMDVALEGTAPVPVGTAAAYIVVENDFAGFPFNDLDRTGTEPVRLGALEVTQAHEFMHAQQFAINVYASGWLMEAHATWTEDQSYDAVNDWHWYIARFLATPDYPMFSRFLYGGAFWLHHLSERYGVGVMRQVWQATRTMSAPDAIRTVAYGGSWAPIGDFAAAQYTFDLSDFTRDPASSIPLPSNVVRATYASYPVSAVVGPSTNKVANRAPWGTGANYVDFLPETANDAIVVRFDGADGYAWRASVILTPMNGGAPQLVPIALDAGAAGSVEIRGLGTRWSKATLAPTIVDLPGREVPFTFGAQRVAATL